MSASEKKELQFREIIIPGDVLEDESLSDGAKILYGKIARLAWKTGKCWSSNSFLDGTKSGRNASRFIAELKMAGYIVIENEKSKDRKIMISRVESRINIANSGEVNKNNTNPANSGEVNENNTNIANSGEVNKNNTNIANSGEVDEKNIEPTSPILAKYPANSGEVTSPNLATELLNLTYLNKTTTTTSNTPQEIKQLPTVEKVVAAESIHNSKDVRNALAAIDKSLILKADFYAKAAAFLAENHLDIAYLAFIYKQCELRNPTSFDGLYFTLFFAENMTEKYKVHPAAKIKLPPPHVPCPACCTVHSPDDELCPACGLPKGSSSRLIAHYCKLYKLSPEKRDEYLRREESLYEQYGGNPANINSILDELKQEFGLLPANEVVYEKPSRNYHSRF
jgi:hypothetical protein